MEDYSEIIQKARQLSDMINSHEVTVRYRESLEKIRADSQAQNLLAQLIQLGGELSRSMDSPETENSMGSAELELLNRQMEENPIVKEHLVA